VLDQFEGAVVYAVRTADERHAEATVELGTMGLLRVRAERSTHGLGISLMLDSADVARWVMGHKAEMLQTLHSSGIAVSSLEVSVSTGGGTGFAGKDEHEDIEEPSFGSNGTRAARGGPPPSRSSRGDLNLIA